MRKTLALVAAMSIASASIALPAQAAQPNGHPANFGGFISGILHLGFKPQPPFPPPHSFVGVCRILEVDWLVKACEAGFPGGGASPS
jgi:hypothetical protein